MTSPFQLDRCVKLTVTGYGSTEYEFQSSAQALIILENGEQEYLPSENGEKTHYLNYLKYRPAILVSGFTIPFFAALRIGYEVIRVFDNVISLFILPFSKQPDKVATFFHRLIRLIVLDPLRLLTRVVNIIIHLVTWIFGIASPTLAIKIEKLNLRLFHLNNWLSLFILTKLNPSPTLPSQPISHPINPLATPKNEFGPILLSRLLFRGNSKWMTDLKIYWYQESYYRPFLKNAGKNALLEMNKLVGVLWYVKEKELINLIQNREGPNGPLSKDQAVLIEKFRQTLEEYPTESGSIESVFDLSKLLETFLLAKPDNQPYQEYQMWKFMALLRQVFKPLLSGDDLKQFNEISMKLDLEETLMYGFGTLFY